ncbi:MAG: single-strand DNA-binding protein [Saprospiraceae bacterium]|jgi:single-strand DNA-binding protein
MAFDIEGKLFKKFDIQQVTDSFRKREFVIEIQDGAYPQLIKFQMTQSNCEKLDSFAEDNQIKVTFSLKGREYTKDGKTSYFTNLDAWRVEKIGGETSSPSATTKAFPDAADEPAAMDTPGSDDLPF